MRRTLVLVVAVVMLVAVLAQPAFAKPADIAHDIRKAQNNTFEHVRKAQNNTIHKLRVAQNNTLEKLNPHNRN